MLRELVVERPAGLVGRLRVPVNPVATGIARGLIDRPDKLPADAEPSQPLGGKEILQIAHVLHSVGAAVEEVVHEADYLSRLLCNKGMDRFAWIEEPLPGRLGNALGKRRASLASIKGVVGIPERPPALVVGLRDGPDRDYSHEFQMRRAGSKSSLAVRPTCGRPSAAAPCRCTPSTSEVSPL